MSPDTINHEIISSRTKIHLLYFIIISRFMIMEMEWKWKCDYVLSLSGKAVSSSADPRRFCEYLYIYSRCMYALYSYYAALLSEF